ncbi:MAG TPA: homoserine kinase [bacterium]|jgi:homoserine kinase
MTVRVGVSASLANFGPALDALALAISVRNELEADLAARPEIIVEGEGAGILSTGEDNLSYRAAAEVAARAGTPRQFSIRCRNRVPIGRGLGSSAAAIVGGAVAANALLGEPFDRTELLEIAAGLEGHPDNVAAALFGGAVLTARNGAGWTWVQLLPVWDAELVVAIPALAVSTEAARRVLAARVPLADAVANVGRTGLLITAMLTGRAQLLGTAMEDALHQPYRAELVPGMAQVFAAARAVGAFGAALCGAGPSIVAVCRPDLVDAVGTAMVGAFAEAGQSAVYLRVSVDPHGATVHET